MAFFGLMTKKAHEAAMAAMKAESRRWIDELNDAYRETRELRAQLAAQQERAGSWADAAQKLDAEVERLTNELARLRPIAEKAEARKAQQMKNLLQNKRRAA